MHRSSPPILILRNLGKKESHPHLLNAINPSRSLRIRSFPRRIDRFIRFSLDSFTFSTKRVAREDFWESIFYREERMPSRLSRSRWFTQLRGVLFANRNAHSGCGRDGHGTKPLSLKEPRFYPTSPPEFVLVAKRIEEERERGGNRARVEREREANEWRREVTYVSN